MTKSELIKFLTPFDDNIEIKVDLIKNGSLFSNYPVDEKLSLKIKSSSYHIGLSDNEGEVHLQLEHLGFGNLFKICR